MKDILFKTEDHVFSYRVAGVCIHNGAVLLQKPTNDTAHAFPGGHVALGETNEQTLIREFREEIGADITVGDLMWVGELFFPWGDKLCHQICLYYAVEIADDHTAMTGKLMGVEHLEHRNFEMEFYWIPIDRLSDIEVYPIETDQLIFRRAEGVQHFVYRETADQKSEIIIS